MSDSVIKVNNLSKKYRIAHEGVTYMTLRDKMAHPLRALSQIKTKQEDFWALENVSFEVKQGDVVGIIGPNGSGKSTLLKILSRITPPTKGQVIIRGRVASLLEVGTGFHPELTGRENIYLSGVILGMTRAEIQKHFDEIIAFSGVEKFIDTPVKRYSSGMMVRLGFAVAAHLEPEILIIDEVLAVGDAEFQKRCLGKMDEITKNDGRTILFVSHNISAIKNLCNVSLLFKSGLIEMAGDTNLVVDKYLNYNRISSGYSENQNRYPIVRDDISINNFDVKQGNRQKDNFDGGRGIDVIIAFDVKKKLENFRIGFLVKNASEEIVCRTLLADWNPGLEKIEVGSYRIVGKVPENFFTEGSYYFEVYYQKNYDVSIPTSTLVKITRSSEFNINHLDEPPAGYVLHNAKLVIEKIQ